MKVSFYILFFIFALFLNSVGSSSDPARETGSSSQPRRRLGGLLSCIAPCASGTTSPTRVLGSTTPARGSTPVHTLGQPPPRLTSAPSSSRPSPAPTPSRYTAAPSSSRHSTAPSSSRHSTAPSSSRYTPARPSQPHSYVPTASRYRPGLSSSPSTPARTPPRHKPGSTAEVQILGRTPPRASGGLIPPRHSIDSGAPLQITGTTHSPARGTGLTPPRHSFDSGAPLQITGAASPAPGTDQTPPRRSSASVDDYRLPGLGTPRRNTDSTRRGWFFGSSSRRKGKEPVSDTPPGVKTNIYLVNALHHPVTVYDNHGKIFVSKEYGQQRLSDTHGVQYDVHKTGLVMMPARRSELGDPNPTDGDTIVLEDGMHGVYFQKVFYSDDGKVTKSYDKPGTGDRVLRNGVVHSIYSNKKWN